MALSAASIPLATWPVAAALAIGVLYATTFRLGNSALLIFPFFLGVGGIYDVLIQSRVVASIDYAEWRTIGLVVCMAGAFVWYWRSAGARHAAGARA